MTKFTTFITPSLFTSSGSVNISSDAIAPSYTIGSFTAETDSPFLSIKADGSLQLGDYNITVKELVLCLKMMKEQAKKEYPEEFI